MSFNSLSAAELKKVVDFFGVDVEASDPEKPTKKEMVAALAAGDKPVTWEDYKTTYEEGKAGAHEPTPVKPVDHSNKNEEDDKKEEPSKTKEDDTSNDDSDSEDEDDTEYVLVKMIRKNGTFEAGSHRFTSVHPFNQVPKDTADALVEYGGFRVATSKELEDYYR